MLRFSAKKTLLFFGALLLAMATVVACSSEPEVIETQVVVEKVVDRPVEVIKEVVVEKQVVTEVEVPGETVVVERQVVKEVMVPGETVVVEKEVQVVVEKEVVKEVEVEVPVEVEKIVEVEVEKVVEVEKIVEVMAPEGPKETIVFSDLNWTSAQVQNRIAQYIVEEGYGYPTDVVFGATLPLFQGLRRGDSHVTMEIWLPNQDEAWMEAQAMGEVISVGESLGKDWQSAFVIPAYLQDQYPDLDSIDDLKDDQYKMLFETAETGGKARLVSCVIGWACETVNASQIEGYGLADHVHVVNPGDGAAANADLYGAYQNQEPWLGYQWGTNDPALVLDLVRLEEPAYSDECWFTTKACAYEDATILIAVYPEVMTNAPDVVQMLRAWDFNIGVYKSVAAWLAENEGASSEDAALWWLNSSGDLWGAWVSADAKSAIDAALAAGEIPDGWPES